MSGDPASNPAFVGVKQPAFDTMVGQHVRAAARIDQLARALWAELNKVQLDTAPAIRLRDMASRLRAQANDLQRRQRLVHQMERQKISFGFCTNSGTFWQLPDRLGALQARVDGGAAADLAEKAAAGDRKALSRLAGFAAEAGDPHFAKALLEALGADGTITLPAGLAQRLRTDMDARDPALGADETGVRSALKLLSKALAVGTDPSGEGYVGDAFLDRLKAQGRADHRFPVGGPNDAITGYQSLATLLDLSDGRPPFSVRFLRVVGRDMIAYDREHRPRNPLPSASPPVVLPYVPGTPRRRPEDGSAPMPDLTGLLRLGWALTPPGDRATVEPPAKGRTDFLNGLLHIAGFSKAGAQALLDHTPAGQRNSDLEYLLHERRARWAYTDHGTRLGQTMKAAMSGHDATSQRLFKETSQLLGRDTRRYFTYDKDHHLRFADTDGHADDLSGLRPSLGDILSAHLKDIDGAFFGEVLAQGRVRTVPSPRDTDALLAEAGQSDEAFTALVRKEIGRARTLLDQQYADGKGIEYWCDLVSRRALTRMSGASAHLSEIRNAEATEDSTICGVRDKERYGPLGVQWDATGGRAEIAEWMKEAASDHPAALPAQLGTGFIVYSLSESRLPYFTASTFGCGARDPWIEIFVRGFSQGRDTTKDLTDLMRFAQRRFGALHHCTPRPNVAS
jgi:hypothetical protein